MIIPKSIGYQGDNVQLTVEYDLEGKTHVMTLYAKLIQVYKMNDEELKEYVRGRVASERASRLRELVEMKLSSIIDVDLEVT